MTRNVKVTVIYIFMAALCNKGALYYCPMVSSYSFFPRLISAVADIVWIQNAGLKRAARSSLEMQDAKKILRTAR